jgi:predicted ATPase
VSLIPRTSPTGRRIMMFDPVAASLAESSRNRWITGYLARAVMDADEAVNIGRALRHPDSLAFALAFQGWLYGHRGDWAACIASTDSGIAIARDSDSVQTLAWNRCVHGWGAAHAGAINVGRAELTAGIEASTAIMGQVALPQFYAMMAEVLLLERDVQAASQWIDKAITLMTANSDMYFAAELHRLAGACDRERGRSSTAIQHLRTALDVARAQGAKLFELRAALDLSEIDPTDGHAAVAAALSDFPEPEPWPEISRGWSLEKSL